jgi:hypothetical protein
MIFHGNAFLLEEYQKLAMHLRSKTEVFRNDHGTQVLELGPAARWSKVSPG